jgi:hypothetical protein
VYANEAPHRVQAGTVSATGLMNYLFIESEVDTIIIGDLGNSVILTGSSSDVEAVISLIQGKDELL